MRTKSNAPNSLAVQHTRAFSARPKCDGERGTLSVQGFVALTPTDLNTTASYVAA